MCANVAQKAGHHVTLNGCIWLQIQALLDNNHKSISEPNYYTDNWYSALIATQILCMHI